MYGANSPIPLQKRVFTLHNKCCFQLSLYMCEKPASVAYQDRNQLQDKPIIAQFSFFIMLEPSISLTGTYSTCGVSILKSILRSPSDSQVALENLIIREYQAIIWEDAYSPLHE